MVSRKAALLMMTTVAATIVLCDLALQAWAQPPITEFWPGTCEDGFTTCGENCYWTTISDSTCVSGSRCAVFSGSGTDALSNVCVTAPDVAPVPPCKTSGDGEYEDECDGLVYSCPICTFAGNWTCNAHGTACGCGIGTGDNASLLAYPC